jgi:hypothetical protein
MEQKIFLAGFFSTTVPSYVSGIFVYRVFIFSVLHMQQQTI